MQTNARLCSGKVGVPLTLTIRFVKDKDELENS